MFRVLEKETDKPFDVYDITYDAITGYPQFLIYKDGQWLRVSAKHFEPYEAEDDPVLRLLDKWETDELKEQYESDSRPSRWTKAWQDLREYVEENGIDCDTEHVTYDFYTGQF